MWGMSNKDVLPSILAYVWVYLGLLTLSVLVVIAAFSDPTQDWLLANWRVWLAACGGSVVLQALTILVCSERALERGVTLAFLLLLAGITASTGAALALAGILSIWRQ